VKVSIAVAEPSALNAVELVWIYRSADLPLNGVKLKLIVGLAQFTEVG